MSHAPASTRPAFTLAECLVAVTLFAVGLLALSTTVVAVQRITAAAARRAEAAALGSARLEELRGSACAARAGGAQLTHGIAEEWRVSAGPGVTLASDTMRLPPARGVAAIAVGLSAAFPC